MNDFDSADYFEHQRAIPEVCPTCGHRPLAHPEMVTKLTEGPDKGHYLCTNCGHDFDAPDDEDVK